MMLFVVLVSCLGLIFTVIRAGRAPSQRPHSLSMGKCPAHPSERLGGLFVLTWQLPGPPDTGRATSK